MLAMSSLDCSLRVPVHLPLWYAIMLLIILRTGVVFSNVLDSVIVVFSSKDISTCSCFCTGLKFPTRMLSMFLIMSWIRLTGISYSYDGGVVMEPPFPGGGRSQ